MAELETLSTKGFKWMKGDQEITSTVNLLMVSVDTPARAMVQNFVQFNGAHGCSWCETSGRRIKKGRGHVQVYPSKQKMKNRYLKRTHRHAAYAIETDAPHRGVKGWSPFTNIYDFDYVEGCVYDAMHAVDLGVTRQLSNLWFDSKNSKSPWYIGTPTLIVKIDSLIAQIHPPSNVTRLPRSINDMGHWKSSPSSPSWPIMATFGSPYSWSSLVINNVK
jgi:hypothetical protein